MTRDDIITAASKSGFETKRGMIWVDIWEITPMLTRFAALVAAAEREACAVAAEMVPAQWDYPVEIPHPAQACHDCAAAIRARGQA